MWPIVKGTVSMKSAYVQMWPIVKGTVSITSDYVPMSPIIKGTVSRHIYSCQEIKSNLQYVTFC